MLTTKDEELNSWLPIGLYPKRGQLVILLVPNRDDGSCCLHPTEDENSFRTIGMNNFLNDQDDTWHIAGWCWEHDHFTQSSGQPTHFQPLPGRPK